MAAGLYALRGFELAAHKLTGLVTRGVKCESRIKYLISDYKPAPLPFLIRAKA